jgi:hypothetical protein
VTTTVIFANQTQYEFARECLQTLTTQGFSVLSDPLQLALTTDHAVVNHLLQRLAENRPTILPQLGKQLDQWLLVGPKRYTLEQTLTRVTAFIVPAYAEFSSNNGFAELLSFDARKNRVHQLGAQLFTLGYYSWESPVSYRKVILDRLGLWLNLEAIEPALALTPQHSYRDLLHLFTRALSDENWSEAESARLEMQRLNLTTAENLHFLRIQWLARQRKWQEIWEHPDFEILARLRMPREVRAAMLTGFHHANLISLERQEQWRAAVALFRETRTRLGTLLLGRFGITQAPVLRVFGYQALLDNDPSTLDQLLAEATDPETSRCLNALKKLLIPGVHQAPSLSPLQQALLSLESGNYDRVLELIRSIEDTSARVLLAVEVAYHSRDDVLIKEAWTIYQSLSPEQNEALISDQGYVSRYLAFLQENNTEQPESIWKVDELRARDEAWKGICNVEYRLRRLVESRYSLKFGDAWESDLDPESREKWTAAQAKDEKTFAQYGMAKSSLLDYTYMGDLVGLINRQWTLFEDVLGAGKAAKQEFTRATEAIIRVRNPLAHNRAVPVNELRRASVYCTDLLMKVRPN